MLADEDLPRRKTVGFLAATEGQKTRRSNELLVDEEPIEQNAEMSVEDLLKSGTKVVPTGEKDEDLVITGTVTKKHELTSSEVQMINSSDETQRESKQLPSGGDSVIIQNPETKILAQETPDYDLPLRQKSMTVEPNSFGLDLIERNN